MRRSGGRFFLACAILAGGVVSLARADEEAAAVRAAAREYGGPATATTSMPRVARAR
jgi:hypothetical protein